MDEVEARELLRQQLAEFKAAQGMLTTARATMESSRLIIAGICKRYPNLETGVSMAELQADPWESGEKPRGSEAVLATLQVNENQWFTVAQMVQALDDRGWLPESENPANAVRTALERLVTAKDTHVEKGRRKHDQTVVYRFTEMVDDPWEKPLPGGGFDEEPPF